MNEYIFKTESGFVEPALYGNSWDCHDKIIDVIEVDDAKYFHWPGFFFNKIVLQYINGQVMLFLFNKERGLNHYSDGTSYDEVKLFFVASDDGNPVDDYRYALLRCGDKWGIKQYLSAGDDSVECLKESQIKFTSIKEAFVSLGEDYSKMKEMELEDGNPKQNEDLHSMVFNNEEYLMSTKTLSEKLKGNMRLEGIRSYSRCSRFGELGGMDTNGHTYFQQAAEGNGLCHIFYLESYSSEGEPVYKKVNVFFDSLYTVTMNRASQVPLVLVTFWDNWMYSTRFIRNRKDKTIIIYEKREILYRPKGRDDMWDKMDFLLSVMISDFHGAELMVIHRYSNYEPLLDALLYDNKQQLTITLERDWDKVPVFRMKSIRLESKVPTKISLPTEVWVDDHKWAISNVLSN